MGGPRPGIGALAADIADPAAPYAFERCRQALDDAITTRALSRAIYAWREAYDAALATTRWEPLAEVGDRALKIDALAAGRTRHRDEAQRAYQFALARARAANAKQAVARLIAALEGLGTAR
jgi:hypothetical protein